MQNIPFNMNDYNPEKLHELFGMKKQFIGYLNILGFAEKVNKEDKHLDLQLLHTINDIITQIKLVLPTLKNTDNPIKMKVFSDNFLFCTDNDYYALFALISLLQSSFVTCDLFIRGSLYYGELVFNNEFVYGKGLIEAYKIENEIAIFPRIIVDDTFLTGAHEIVNQLSREKLAYDTFLESLSDGYCIDFENNKYVNYLAIMEGYILDGSSNYDFRELLQTHATNIKRGLQSKNKRNIQKYQWCRKYHNEICQNYHHNDLHIDFS